MVTTAISKIAVYLPEQVLSNDQLALQYPGWTAEKIQEKTGIVERRVAAPDEFTSDMARSAATLLFEKGSSAPADIDYLLVCTQSPDYLLPTTACLVQAGLGLRTNCGAIDINMGCSGYIYGLGLAKGLIETGQAANVLLITAETYTRYIHPEDKSVRTLFGDGATATLLKTVEADQVRIGPFVYGTDGRGAHNLIVPTGGSRRPFEPDAKLEVDNSGNARTANNLFMNGAEIFAFTLKAVPKAIHELLDKAGLGMEDIDLFLFHQANQYMLEHLRKKLNIPSEKLPIHMSHCGNTVSSTLPILLEHLESSGRLRTGQRLLLLGFGVGYSWGGTIVHW